MGGDGGGMEGVNCECGVGEGSPENRKWVCEKLKHLDLEPDQAANENCKPDADSSMPASPARILVIATREDLTIMRETRRLVGSSMSRLRGNGHVNPL